MPPETIYALSSASGRAGVAVVRMSGPAVREVTRQLCGGDVPARLACLRAVRDPRSREVLDHAVILFFPAPRSFTGEDVVEFQVHGSIAVVRRLIAALSSFEGCRPASAGEFARRAFLNGRIDLVEVEALGDLLSAETEMQRKLAVEGSRRLRLVASDWRTRLLHLRGICEAHIDFSDESDVSQAIDSDSERDIKALHTEILAALAGLDAGQRVRAGFRVAVLGPPNAGKSTLVNALADRDVSITSPVPGTTRDVVEVHLDLGGFAVIIADTAGIRGEGSDIVEEEGMRRAWRAADAADIVVWVSPVDSDAICPFADCIRVASMADLGVALSQGGVLHVSGTTGYGMKALIEAIRDRCASLNGDSAFGSLVAHERQAQRLRAASAHLSRALAFSDATLDMRAEELRLACGALDMLTGKIGNEDVLDVVFAQFCIGK